MEPNLGKLEGTGHITRADGTKVEFTITSDITEEQAEGLDLKPSDKEELKEKKQWQ